MRWRCRLPDLTADDSDDEATIVTAAEVQEQLGAFKGATRRRIEDLRQVTMALEDRVNILRRARDDTWELVNDRVTAALDRISTTLSDRVTRIERIVRSKSATPVTPSDQNLVGQEEFAQLESRIEARFQAFTHEVDLLREELAHSVEGQNRHLRSGPGGSSPMSLHK